MTEDRDFFISYTGADQAWAEWIADTLERAGYSIVLQAWDFRPGEVFVERMHQAVDQAKRTILVLSNAYLASAFATSEWQAVFAKDPTGHHGLLLPVRIVDCQPPGLLRGRIYVDLAGLDELTAAARLLEGVKQDRIRPTGRVRFPGTARPRPTFEAPPFPGRPPAIFKVPPRNPNFTGRGELIQELRRKLADTATGAVVQAEAIHGLGGVGKTQLAVEYVHRFAADYELIWWVSAEEPIAIAGQLAALSRRLDLPQLPNLNEQVAALFDELGQRDGWLLVYDNVEGPATLTGYRPPAGRGHLLITSRNPAWSGIAGAISLDVLSREESVAFLRQRLSRDDPILSSLAEALGDLPLALEQAAGYIDETQTSVAEYLELLRDRAPELFSLGTTNSEQTIATTWNLSFTKVNDQAPAAQDFLNICAFLAPDDIPRSLLADHPDRLPDRLAIAVRDRLGLQQAIGALLRYSLVTVSDQSLGVHRLVQAVTRHNLTSAQQRELVAVAVELLCDAFPNRAEDAETWPICARLLPHVVAATDHADSLDAARKPTADLLTMVARYLWGRAEHNRAKALHERALAIREASLGREHPDVAESLSGLGVVLRWSGELSEARRAHERALAIREASLGPDHPSVGESFNNLGLVLWNLGLFSEARQAHERALAIREDGLGPDHPNVGQSLNNLGLVLWNLGSLSEARQAHERALRIRETRLGLDHPNVGESFNNIGLVLRDLGELAEARRAHERALMIRKTRLSPNHPDIAQSYNNLGLVLRDLGELAEARRAHERALMIHRTSLREDHPDVADSLEFLGMVLCELGEASEARRVHERALDIRESQLGPDHTRVARGLNGLGMALHSLGALREARQAHERALTIRETRLGAQHPETAQSLRSLALVLRGQGDTTGASILLKRALAVYEARLGSNHPATVQVRFDLAAARR
jgi:tetratricopeptide (TPR) repeat protein